MKQMIDRRNFLAAVSAASFGACAGPTFAQGRPLTPATFLFDLPPNPKHALFYPALELGYYKQAGLDVTFQAGKGSADVAQKVAGKAVQFGFADAGITILARGRDMPLKLVGMVHYKNMMVIISRATSNIAGPADLVGKKVAATAGDSVRIALPAVAAKAGFDASKVEFVTVESNAKASLLVAGKVDAVCDYASAFPIYETAMTAAGQKVNKLLYADYGVDVYSNGIIVHEDTIKSDPALVKAFVGALVKGLKFAADKPDDAVAIFRKYNGSYEAPVVRAGLGVARDHMLVPEVRQHGIGPMSESKVTATVAVTEKYFGLAKPVAVAQVFTNEFAPAGVMANE